MGLCRVVAPSRNQAFRNPDEEPAVWRAFSSLAIFASSVRQDDDCIRRALAPGAILPAPASTRFSALLTVKLCFTPRKRYCG